MRLNQNNFKKLNKNKNSNSNNQKINLNFKVLYQKQQIKIYKIKMINY